ncbi:MAG: CPBP family intramembrane glutamic endopeptidase [Actinomycetota bacterium]
MVPAAVVALAVAGPVAVAGAWVVVRRRGVSIWVAMGAAVGVMGGLALATGRVRAAAEVGMGPAAAAGLGAGVALYLATAAFLAMARRWPPLTRHAEALYDQRRGLSLGAALGVAVLVVSPGEELLWRGIVQPVLAEAVGAAFAAVLAWAAYVATNAVSASIPIVLGAVVGGAAWGALALWSGGVVAGILCHGVWTGLMIARPPIGAGR